ncbi:MAG: S-layer homology domain-containing protein, partial [Clostridia bacterium]|nr:S-layer homology domain-containing protein [Clostridia bacterium]
VNDNEVKLANSNTGEKINKDVKFIQGYEDGSFKPENKVSNIELMCMVTSLFDNVDLKDSKIDLNQGNDFWGEDTIKKANILNLIPGDVNDKNYDVNNKVTRYDLALVIYNLIGDKEKENKLTNDNNCNDIIGTNYEEAVTKLINLGIIRGYEDGLFHGDNELSRAEAVVIINRTLKSLGINKISNNFKSYFNDLDITHWAYDEIMRAAN